MSKRVMYYNAAARVIYLSYEPSITVNRPFKPWQFAIIELIAMAVIGFVIVYI